jgi:F-type H+-transporting ATPase subunit gamma
MRQVIGHLAHSGPEYRHIYMQEREIRRVGYLVVSSDKGLCGGLNVNLFRALVKDMASWNEQNVEIDLGLIGNKAQAFFRSFGGNVVAAISNLGEEPLLADLIGGIKVMLDAFEQERVDRVYVIYNVFVNTMTQQPTVRQLLPLEPEDSEELKHRWDYIYEPDAKELIEGLMARFIESQVYQAVVENTACEQAAKMVAMKAATENAGEMIDELQLLYNNARQASITQELSEIVAGAAAL